MNLQIARPNTPIDLQATADAKKARARWMRERSAEHRDHATRLDAHATNLMEEAANLERMIDAGAPTAARADADTLWERRFMPAQPDDSPFILPSDAPPKPQTKDTNT